ncbi:hypothetical protein SNEBB_003323 [Seison nebaliae]|nr:hypothetical protein SNEBB_003323 [Seison nebaliae]
MSKRFINKLKLRFDHRARNNNKNYAERNEYEIPGNEIKYAQETAINDKSIPSLSSSSTTSLSTPSSTSSTSSTSISPYMMISRNESKNNCQTNGSLRKKEEAPVFSYHRNDVDETDNNILNDFKLQTQQRVCRLRNRFRRSLRLNREHRHELSLLNSYFDMWLRENTSCSSDVLNGFCERIEYSIDYILSQNTANYRGNGNSTSHNSRKTTSHTPIHNFYHQNNQIDKWGTNENIEQNNMTTTLQRKKLALLQKENSEIERLTYAAYGMDATKSTQLINTTNRYEPFKNQLRKNTSRTYRSKSATTSTKSYISSLKGENNTIYDAIFENSIELENYCPNSQMINRLSDSIDINWFDAKQKYDMIQEPSYNYWNSSDSLHVYSRIEDDDIYEFYNQLTRSRKIKFTNENILMNLNVSTNDWNKSVQKMTFI